MWKIIIPVLVLFSLSYEIKGKTIFKHIGDYVASSIINDINKTNKEVEEQAANRKS
jgi:hypothetical protein